MADDEEHQPLLPEPQVERPEVEKPTDKRKVTLSAVLCVISAAVGSLLYGYDTGVIAGALLYIVPEFGLEEKPIIEGAIVTITLFGALFGTFIGGKLADFFGRKKPLLASSLLFICGGGLMFWSPGVEVLIAGRFIVGLAIGVSGVIIPAFISECAPASVRGMLATFPQLFISTGILTSYTVDFAISMTGAESWRLMLGVSVAPAVLQFFLVIWLPESPRWYVMKGQFDEARKVLRRLREQENVEEELQVIIKGTMQPPVPSRSDTTTIITTNGSSPSASNSLLKDLRAPGIPKILLAGCGLQFFQQLSGINAIVYYTPTILKESGIEDLFEGMGLSEESASILGTIFCYIPKIPSLLLAMWLIDRVGRRKLLLSTTPILALCLGGLAVSFFFSEESSTRAILCLVCITLYGCCFVAGLGAIPNIFCSEIFPPHLRAVGLSICIGVQWTFNIVVSQSFPWLRDNVGLPITFTIFMSCCIVGTFFIYFLIPETKGKSLEQTSKAFNVINQEMSNDERKN